MKILKLRPLDLRIILLSADQTNAMTALMQRNLQFARECPTSANQTCSRILNHPDPCPMCWAGGYEHQLATGGADEPDSKPTCLPNLCRDHLKNQPCCNRSPEDLTAQTQQACAHGDNALVIEKEITGYADECNEGKRHSYQIMNDIRPKMESATSCDIGPKASYPETETACEAKEVNMKGDADQFGPWVDSHREQCLSLPQEEEAILVPEVYHFKLPSSIHCWCKLNGYAPRFNPLEEQQR